MKLISKGVCVCMCVCVCVCLPAHYLVFAPEQIKASAVDGRAEEVQAMVCDTEV